MTAKHDRIWKAYYYCQQIQYNLRVFVSKYQPKFILKYIKNVLKNLRKSRSRGTKIDVWRRLGASWGRLGASWGVFGCLGGILGRLVAVLGASWLEKGGQHGSNLAPKAEPKSKIEAKIVFFLNAFWDQIFEGCWWILEAKWNQVGTQMASKIDPNIVFPLEKPWF